MDSRWKTHPIVHDLTWWEMRWTFTHTLATDLGTAKIWRAYETIADVTISEADCINWRLILRVDSKVTEELLVVAVEPLIEHAETILCAPPKPEDS